MANSEEINFMAESDAQIMQVRCNYCLLSRSLMMADAQTILMTR
jgi:hypothetical protein